MTDPSFLLPRAAAKDLMELARDLQAMVDFRASALEHPLTNPDFDITDFGPDEQPAPRAGH